MSPKYKANELINLYYDTTYNSANDYSERHRISKQCALIAVDEILRVAPIDKYENLNSSLLPEELGLHLFEEYWQEVKQHINNI